MGWNTRWVDGAWQPTLPRAQYLFAEDEWHHWRQEASREYGPVIEDSVQPMTGQAVIVSQQHQVTDEVLQPTPGHTPVSVHIQSNGEAAIITGMIHHPVR